MRKRMMVTVVAVACVVSGCAVAPTTHHMLRSAPSSSGGAGIAFRPYAPAVRHVTLTHPLPSRDVTMAPPLLRDGSGGHMDMRHPALRYRREW